MLSEIELRKHIDKIVLWMQEYVNKVGAKGVVIGNSGGKDSATVIALASLALGKEKVLTVGMPCQSKEKDLEDAKLVAQTFGIKILEINLTDTYEKLEKELNTKIGEELAEEAKINIKPRLRMTTLYAIAQNYNYLVMGTGNLCEAMVGYTTKWGDSASDFNPIANFTVDEVLKIGEILGVPEKIIKKEPSDGLSDKSDEEKMGITYTEVAEYIETGKTNEDKMKKIEKRYMNSKHKREKIPTYDFERKNYLNELK